MFVQAISPKQKLLIKQRNLLSRLVTDLRGEWLSLPSLLHGGSIYFTVSRYFLSYSWTYSLYSLLRVRWDFFVEYRRDQCDKFDTLDSLSDQTRLLECVFHKNNVKETVSDVLLTNWKKEKRKTYKHTNWNFSRSEIIKLYLGLHSRNYFLVSSISELLFRFGRRQTFEIPIA